MKGPIEESGFVMKGCMKNGKNSMTRPSHRFDGRTRLLEGVNFALSLIILISQRAL
jgi:hypothetical protein